MPIYQYAPVTDGNPSGQQDDGARSCCYFEFLHRQGEAPLKRCPHCGAAIQKVPSLFSSHLSRRSKTSDALRAAGKADFAEAWEEAKAKRSPKAPIPSQEALDEAYESASSEGQAHRALSTLRHHVCTASCTHGPLHRGLSDARGSLSARTNEIPSNPVGESGGQRP